MPLFSIIIPVYNAELYLEQCLNSIINQSFTDYELLLINDGSTDNSLLLCDTFAATDARIKVIHKHNTGAYDTRNVGLQAACGDYLIFVDADDCLLTLEAFALLGSLIKQHHPEILATNAMKTRNQKKTIYLLTPSPEPCPGREFLKSQLKNDTYIVGIWQYIYQRQFIHDHHLTFHTALHGSDKLWVAQTLYLAHSVMTIDLLYYHYIKRPNSITTSTSSKKKIYSHINIARALYDYFINIEDHELKQLLMVRIAGAYFTGLVHACKMNDFSFIDKNFLKNDLFQKNKYMPWKSRGKIFLFNLHPKLLNTYFVITRIGYFIFQRKTQKKS